MQRDRLKSLSPYPPTIDSDDIFTTREYAEAHGIGREAARTQVNQMFKMKMIKPVMVMRPTASGILKRTPAWEIMS